MFNRVTYEEWTSIVPLISFGVSFAIFIVMSFFALRSSKDRTQAQACIPLRNDEQPRPTDSASHE